MYYLGIFPNEQSLGQIMRVDEKMRRYSNVTYLPYSSPDHLKFLYEQNAGKCDACLLYTSRCV